MDFSTKILEDTLTQKILHVDVSKEATQQYFANAVIELSESHILKGFRPGKVPFETGLKAFGQARVVSHATQIALYDIIPKLIKIEGFRLLGQPFIQFGDVRYNNALEFTVTLGRYPQNISFEYKDITITQQSPKVSDEEIERTLEMLKQTGGATVIDDAFAKSVGHFKDLEDLKRSIREGLMIDKSSLYYEQARVKLLEAISKKARIDIPEIAISQEVDRRITAYQHALESKKSSWQDYLTNIKKTEDKIRDEESKAVRQDFTHAIILEEIATREGIIVSEEEVTQRFNALLLQYRNAKHAQKELDIPAIKAEIVRKLKESAVFEKILDKQITH